MQPRLTELLDYLDAQRTRVLAAASVLPLDRWAARPASDRWSVAEVAWHLHRVEKGIARLIAKRVAEARALGHPAEAETTSVLGTLDDRHVMDRNRRIQAPTHVAPNDVPDPATVQRQLDESRAMLRSAVAEADGLALGGITHPHPALGDIDLYQWILFVGQHEARHVEQIEETTSALAG